MEIHNPQAILREQIEAKGKVQRERLGLQAALPDVIPGMQQEIRNLRAELNAVKERVNEIILEFNKRPGETPSE